MYTLIVLQMVLESLPISSTGHISIFSAVLPAVFEDLSHGPTALIILYLFKNEITFFTTNAYIYKKEIYTFVSNILIATVVTVTCYGLINIYGLPSVPLSFGFLISGFFLIFSHYFYKKIKNKKKYINLKNINLMTTKEALLLGLIQSVAFIPGISRMGITYSFGLLLGFNPMASFTFSLAMAVPIFGAASLKGLFLIVTQNKLHLITAHLLLLVLCSTVISYFIFLWVINLIKKEKFWYFGLYLIIAATVLFLTSFS